VTDPPGTALTSTLSVGEFAALRTIGYEPVGQAVGVAVFDRGFLEACPYPGGTPPFVREPLRADHTIAAPQLVLGLDD
jgi:hypothetical protein